MVQITLCWSLQARQVHECALSVPEHSTVQSVIDQFITEHTQTLSPTESAQLKFMQPGIWGHKVAWTALVQEGDRVELYRPLKVDPKVARRQRFKRQGKGRTGLFANRKSGSAAGY
ncbi:RnfH family protein [Limnohabitans sp. T6-5]|uniref:RnfH family protein n=1 Tax=Limnohabitans sp. T6-5 TaxID=1100724 RepID=UPI001E2FDEDE|nr:RnfH family protein [Limnohabitans sp. T6-5]